MEDDYYTPWEWQPVSQMPEGCNEVIVRWPNGNIQEMCSCDYWWGASQDRFPEGLTFMYE